MRSSHTAKLGYRANGYDLKCWDVVVIEIRRQIYDTLDYVRAQVMARATDILQSEMGIRGLRAVCA
jgi:hypothetical protein